MEEENRYRDEDEYIEQLITSQRPSESDAAPQSRFTRQAPPPKSSWKEKLLAKMLVEIETRAMVRSAALSAALEAIEKSEPLPDAQAKLNLLPSVIQIPNEMFPSWFVIWPDKRGGPDYYQKPETAEYGPIRVERSGHIMTVKHKETFYTLIQMAKEAGSVTFWTDAKRLAIATTGSYTEESQVSQINNVRGLAKGIIEVIYRDSKSQKVLFKSGNLLDVVGEETGERRIRVSLNEFFVSVLDPDFRTMTRLNRRFSRALGDIQKQIYDQVRKHMSAREKRKEYTIWKYPIGLKQFCEIIGYHPQGEDGEVSPQQRFKIKSGLEELRQIGFLRRGTVKKDHVQIVAIGGADEDEEVIKRARRMAREKRRIDPLEALP